MEEEVNIQLGYKDGMSWFNTNSNKVLKKGQIVYLGQTGTYKIGDGITKLGNLSFKGIGTNTVTNNTNTTTITNNSDFLAISIVITSNILQGEVINADGTKADSSIIGKRDKLVGISSEDKNSGFPCNVIVQGRITNVNWDWSINDLIYLNGTALSKIPPTTGFIQKIGVAKSATTIEIQIGQSILI